jgi:hypothetical protein
VCENTPAIPTPTGPGVELSLLSFLTLLAAAATSRSAKAALATALAGGCLGLNVILENDEILEVAGALLLSKGGFVEVAASFA